MALPTLTDAEPGTHCNNLEFSRIAKLLGRFPWTSEVFNSHAPEFPNMAMLQLFGAMGGADDTLTHHSVAYLCALVAHRGWT